MKEERAINFINNLSEENKKKWIALLRFNFLDTRYVLEKIRESIPNFDCSQIEEIMYGLQSKLPNRHIFIYAKPEFNSDQMREIRLGFENGIALCDILIYAKPKDFNYEQMKEIRLGFESRLIIDQILKYAKPEIGSKKMKKMRVRYENKNKKKLENERLKSNITTDDILLSLLTR